MESFRVNKGLKSATSPKSSLALATTMFVFYELSQDPKLSAPSAPLAFPGYAAFLALPNDVEKLKNLELPEVVEPLRQPPERMATKAVLRVRNRTVIHLLHPSTSVFSIRDLRCPSSNDLRLFGLWKNGVSGSVCGLI